MDRLYVIRHKWHHEGRSIRQIARNPGVSRNTVRKVRRRWQRGAAACVAAARAAGAGRRAGEDRRDSAGVEYAHHRQAAMGYGNPETLAGFYGNSGRIIVRELGAVNIKIEVLGSVRGSDAAADTRADREGRTVAQRFSEERAPLRPLPRRPFEARHVEPVAVSRQALVRVDGRSTRCPVTGAPARRPPTWEWSMWSWSGRRNGSRSPSSRAAGGRSSIGTIWTSWPRSRRRCAKWLRS